MSAGLRRDDLIFLVKASSREHDLNAEGLGCISNNHEESSNLATDTPQYLYPFSTNSTWLTYRTIEAHRGSAEQLVPQDVYKVLTLNFSSAWFFRIFLSRKRKVMTQRQAIIIRTCSASVMPFTPWLTHLESFLCSGNENSPPALHRAGHKTAFWIILKLCGRGVSVTGAEASQLICWNWVVWSRPVARHTHCVVQTALQVKGDFTQHEDVDDKCGGGDRFTRHRKWVESSSPVPQRTL